MPGRNNLIPFSERSEDEAREFGKKGGVASGRTRRRKANLKRTMETLLAMDLPDCEIKDNLEALGIDPSMEQALALSVLTSAIQKGSYKAFETIRDTIQQTTTLQEKQERRARTAKIKAETEKVQLETKMLKTDPAESESLKNFLDAIQPDAEAIKDLYDDEETEEDDEEPEAIEDATD